MLSCHAFGRLTAWPKLFGWWITIHQAAVIFSLRSEGVQYGGTTKSGISAFFLRLHHKNVAWKAESSRAPFHISNSNYRRFWDILGTVRLWTESKLPHMDRLDRIYPRSRRYDYPSYGVVGKALLDLPPSSNIMCSLWASSHWFSYRFLSYGFVCQRLSCFW